MELPQTQGCLRNAVGIVLAVLGIALSLGLLAHICMAARHR